MVKVLPFQRGPGTGISRYQFVHPYLFVTGDLRLE